jgi:pyruvate/2-oxoglutarate dehydrogenase complex dihydrolipoamide acyltransferase (E2) component
VKLNGEPGQQLKVGDVILSYEGKATAVQKDGAETKPAPASKPAVAVARREVNGPGAAAAVPTKAAPSVRLMARKLGIDLGGIHGSGPDGRILIEDVSRHVQPFSRDPEGSAEEPRPDFGRPGSRIKLIGLRRKIAEHMHHAKHVVPHYGYVDECEITDLVRIREGLKDVGDQRGIKITYLPFFIRAVVEALRKCPSSTPRSMMRPARSCCMTAITSASPPRRRRGSSSR